MISKSRALDDHASLGGANTVWPLNLVGESFLLETINFLNNLTSDAFTFYDLMSRGMMGSEWVSE